MSVFVYCPKKSDGAFGLVKGLGAHRLRSFDGMDFWDKRKRVKLEEGDVIVNWGHCLPDMSGVRVLNPFNPDSSNKFKELALLRNAAIPVPQTLSKEYWHAYFGNGRNYYGDDPSVWKGRRYHHVGGEDFFNPPGKPDFYVKWQPIQKEYRIHSFSGRSIRAGQKVLREGFTLGTEAEFKLGGSKAHPWIRSWDTGWKVSYDGFRSTPKMRKLANGAVKALGLTFGAVDLAEIGDDSYMVLEVNRAPGIEGNTLDTYVRAIQKWIEGNPEGEE
jgi:hypothetical protein